MKKVLIRPVQGRKVIDPKKLKTISAEMEVPLDKFYSRRIKQGDLALVEIKEKQVQKKTITKKNER